MTKEAQNVKDALGETETEYFNTDEFLAFLRELMDKQENGILPD
jgi:hypothetical protein